MVLFVNFNIYMFLIKMYQIKIVKIYNFQYWK